MVSHASRKQALYGREREQAHLCELLDSSIAGHGSLVLVSGEAGIGKTTLVNDFVQHAKEQGCLVLAGGCYALTTTPPYGPWIEAIRGYQPQEDQPSVPVWFGNPDAMAEVGSQTALFEEARQFFAAIAKHQPLVIVLEDLHWSDSASLEALRYIARTLRDVAFLIIATYRDDELTRRHELYQLLPLLVRESQAQRIHLHQFDHDDVREMIADRYDLGDADLDRLVAHVAERSEGNPFFAEEVLQGLEDDRILQPAADGWLLGDLERVQVPQLVRQMLDRRLSTLAAGTLAALQVAAVIGQNVPVELWQGVTGLDDDAFDRAIAEALEARILEEIASSGTLAFRHALLREALYESLILNRRRTWHRQVGEALAEIPTSDPEAVARHFQESGDPRTVRWLVHAAVRAEESYAFQIAVGHYATAQALLEADPDSARVRGWLLNHVGHLLRYTDRERSIAYNDDALVIAHQVRDPVLAASSQNHRGLVYCNRGDYWRGLEDMRQAYRARQSITSQDLQAARQAIASIFPADIFSNPRRLSGGGMAQIGALPGNVSGVHTYVAQLANAGYLQDAIEIGESHIAAVASITQDESLINDNCRDAFAGLAFAFTALGEADRADYWWRRAYDAFRALNHQMMVSAALHNKVWHLLTYSADDVDSLRRISGDAVAIADVALRAVGAAFQPDIHRVPVHVLTGQWDQVRNLASQDSSRRTNIDRHVWIEAIGVLAPEEDNSSAAWNEVRRRFPNLQPDEPGNANFEWSIAALKVAASLSLDEENIGQARTWLDALDHWLDWSGAAIGRAELNILYARYHRLAGDLGEAHRHAEAALDHASNPRQPLALIATHRLLGELDTALERFDEADDHLKAALDLADRCEAPYERALTLLAMAERAAARDDAQEASRVLRKARAICQDLGANRSLARADEIEAGLRRHLAGHPAGLSDREAEVLEQAATGQTNAEIGDALYISPRTVAQHLRSVYNKLGVNSRAAAVARWAELIGSREVRE